MAARKNLTRRRSETIVEGDLAVTAADVPGTTRRPRCWFRFAHKYFNQPRSGYSVVFTMNYSPTVLEIDAAEQKGD
jgi:hypothetical protein